MKKILLFSLLLISKDLRAQYLKIDNGVVVSGFVNNKDLSLLQSSISNYSLWVGSDFLEHKWYYLSTQVGYSVFGGRDRDVFIQNQQFIITESLKYLQLNTTFRAYKRISTLALFAGIGPHVNVLVSSNHFSSDLYNPYKTKQFFLGGKGELGVTQDIHKFRIGLVGSYMMSMTPLAKSDYISLNNNAFSLSFTIGYRIR